MPGLMRRLCAIFAVGMLVGIFGLMLLPSPPQAERAVLAAAPIPDPPSQPCGLQTWPNIDRDCLGWTSSRTGYANVNEAARPAAAIADPAASAVAKVAASAASEVTESKSAAQAADARRVAARKTPRRNVNRNPIPVTVQRPDGTRQRVVIRPTSRQDFFFYAR